MTSKTFIPGTVIDSPWLNDVDAAVYQAASGISGSVDRPAVSKFSDFVNLLDFGSVDLTGVTPATTVFQAAMNAAAAVKKSLRLPSGILSIGNVTWPTGLPGLIGQGSNSTTIQATGTITAFTPLISMTNITGFTISGLTITLNSTTYPQHWNINMSSCTDGIIEDVIFPQSGSAAIRAVGAQDITVRKCKVNNFKDLGIAFVDGTVNQRITIDDCMVMGTGTQTSHNIAIVNGGGHTVTNCSTFNNVAGSFGVSMYKVTGSHISNNTFSNGKAEGCNMQDSSYSTISGNTVIFDSTSGDFGISLFGDPSVSGNCIGIIISNNTIFNSGKSGIAFANRVNNCFVYGNHIHNCNQLAEGHGAAILFYGLGCNSNSAIGNYAFDTSSKMRYVFNEYNDGSGNPSANFSINNVVFGNGLAGEWNTISTETRVSAIGWKLYSPIITSTTGTITSVLLNSAEFKPEGENVSIKVDVTITTNGTGAGSILIPLPAGFTAPTNGGTITGREIVVSGSSISGVVSGSGIIVTKYDGTYPGASTARLVLSGQYKVV